MASSNPASPLAVSGEISAAYYHNHWRFDLEDLPSDLVRRHAIAPSITTSHCLILQITKLCSIMVTDILPLRVHPSQGSGCGGRIAASRHQAPHHVHP
ncbi:putative lipoxygenase 6 [Panicum miliaceum]|uniref:Lipoxygenase 6 n=1 Tax=Panicum miliaceum TaxID=4540 RepID=A0A3L6SD93_PANMI|nr:putative lipoxygenase 6 [Panicum miliaceum]